MKWWLKFSIKLIDELNQRDFLDSTTKYSHNDYNYTCKYVQISVINCYCFSAFHIVFIIKKNEINECTKALNERKNEWINP